MTTIAWDGKFLVGDKQTTNGTTPTKTKKVFKLQYKGKVCLVGCVGRLSDCEEFIRWIKNGADIEKYPKFEDVTALLILHNKRIVRFFSGVPHPSNLNAKVWAEGSGGDYALGAMWHGASAIEAVKIATKLDVNSGFGYDAVSFE